MLFLKIHFAELAAALLLDAMEDSQSIACICLSLLIRAAGLSFPILKHEFFASEFCIHLSCRRI